MFESNKHKGKLNFEIEDGNTNKFRNETEIMKYELKCKYSYERTIYCQACLKRDLNNCNPNDFYRKTCPATNCSNLGYNPCFNNGICLDLDSNETDNISYVQFKCKCQPGYSGLLCLDFRPCEMKPCSVDAECIEIGELGLFYCVTSDNKWFNGLSDKKENSLFGAEKKIIIVAICLFASIVLLILLKKLK